MPCSIFENDETVIGWKAGSSVAYCEPCFREVMEESELKTVNAVDDDSDESREDTVPEKQEERPSTKKKSVNGDKRKRSVYKQYILMYSFEYETTLTKYKV